MTVNALPRAVLFDLYNTLVPGGTRAERDQVSRQMAEVLGVQPEALADLVRRTFDDRTRGRLGDLRQTVWWLANQLGGEVSEDVIDAAVHMRLALTRALHEQTWALPALEELKQAGLRLGLVSDCSAETATIWPHSPLSPYLSAVSLSCVTGHRKPEPEAYLEAVRQLGGIQPHECAFVGDGGSFELTGAAALGMTVFRFQAPGHDPGDPIDDDATWTGPITSDLTAPLTMG